MGSWLKHTIAAILGVLAPLKPTFLIVGFLIFSDLITGILASRKRGEKYSSSKLRNTLSKILIYNLAVLSGYLVEVFLLENFLPISKIVAGTIGMVELTSLYENLNVLQGGNLFKTIISKLGSANNTQSSDESSSKISSSKE